MSQLFTQEQYFTRKYVPDEVPNAGLKGTETCPKDNKEGVLNSTAGTGGVPPKELVTVCCPKLQTSDGSDAKANGDLPGAWPKGTNACAHGACPKENDAGTGAWRCPNPPKVGTSLVGVSPLPSPTDTGCAGTQHFALGSCPELKESEFATI